jgi:cyclohexanone monooxygenase
MPAGSVRGRCGHPAGAMAYFKYIDAWRSTGEFEGLQFR